MRRSIPALADVAMSIIMKKIMNVMKKIMIIMKNVTSIMKNAMKIMIMTAAAVDMITVMITTAPMMTAAVATSMDMRAASARYFCTFSERYR